MILVRQVFQVKIGCMDKVLQIIQSATESQKAAMNVNRVLTDISGKNFTLVMETKAESVDAYMQALQAMFSNPDLVNQGDPFEGLIESGSKDFYTIEYEAAR